MIRSDKIHIAISSHKVNGGIWLGHLLPSLLEDNGIPPQQVHVFVGGCERKEDHVIDDVNYHLVKHNSFDYTCMIEVLNHLALAPYWLVLHDTHCAGKNFWASLLKSTPPANDFTAFSLEGWTNAGVYSSRFLEEQSTFIRSFTNCDKWRAILGERLLTRMGERVSCYASGMPKCIGNFQIVPYFTSRLVYHFEEIDLYKYQQYTLESVEFQSLLAEKGFRSKDIIKKLYI